MHISLVYSERVYADDGRPGEMVLLNAAKRIREID